jgi:hypothetical protein
VNSGTGARYTATSDSEGHFTLELLPPGDYSARVEAPGMSPQETPQLHVDVGGVAELTFHLKIETAQETLTVSEGQAVVETKPAAVSMLLDERSLSDSPLNGRRFSDLTLFSPGVTQDPRGNQRVAITSNGMVANASTFVQSSVTANLAPYPGYYELPNNFMKPHAAYAPRQIQFAAKFIF